jgi:hypothetical protein
MQQTRGLVTYIGPNEAIGSPDHQAFLSVPSKVEYPRYGYERIATKHPAPLTGTITTEWTIKIDTCLCSLQERHHPQYPPVRKAPSLSHLRDIPPMYPDALGKSSLSTTPGLVQCKTYWAATILSAMYLPLIKEV